MTDKSELMQDVENLRRTVGSLLWLDSLNDDEWNVLWNEIAPHLLRMAHQRNEDVILDAEVAVETSRQLAINGLRLLVALSDAIGADD